MSKRPFPPPGMREIKVKSQFRLPGGVVYGRRHEGMIIDYQARQLMARECLRKILVADADMFNVEEKTLLADLIVDTLLGSDPREYFGIKPRRGRLPRTSTFQVMIACHYWELCMGRGCAKEKDETARKLVSEVWGCSEKTVYKYACQNKWMKKWMDVMAPGQWARMANDSATEYRELTEKDRDSG